MLKNITALGKKKNWYIGDLIHKIYVKRGYWLRHYLIILVCYVMSTFVCGLYYAVICFYFVVTMLSNCNWL